MNKKHLFTLWAFLLLLTSCRTNEEHFITDEAYRMQVLEDLQARTAELNKGNLFAVFDQPMSIQEKEAMSFMFAYMPVSDIANYGGDYFLKNVKTSLQAREEMPWGKQIPEQIFRHFVLPVRINNENLDESRMVFYKELKSRVKALSLHDAVLEVNHWCHEKVVYTPSDSRTSSPLASVKTAYGRCGEESTFTVAALRSVGIPARQVYTPRWAHTDDNHAWVEAWVDGKWYFFGACEPEPVLNLGWFNAPASRGMLMHTKVFGKYNGTEEIMQQTPLYTEINVIDNYAKTTVINVLVEDESGRAIADADVEFKVYNYAEFFTVARKKSDANGQTSLTAGIGDMLVWASKDGKFGFTKISFGKDKEVKIQLDKSNMKGLEMDLDVIPPVENSNMPEVTAEQRAENTRRMAEEDSIRNAYVATFVDEAKAEAFAASVQMEKEKANKLLIASRGNYQTLEDFLKNASEDKKIKDAIDLLEVISAKDLRDVSLEVLKDHYKNSIKTANVSTDIYNKYVRNPRVSNEMITPYKNYFQSVIPEDEAEGYRHNPMTLVDWVKKEIKVDDNCNLGGAPIFPEGVWKARVADSHSRDIFFVSLCRSLGIPARLDEVTGKVQLVEDGKFIDINFEISEQYSAAKGKLIATYQPVKALEDPKYYNHFTISKVVNGRLQLLNYEEDGSTWSSLLKNGTELDAGEYVLVSGRRMASGAVLARMVAFHIEEGETTTLRLVMRESNDDVQVIGSFNSENKFIKSDGTETSFLLTTGRGYYIAAILGAGDEPTNHAMRDIAAVKEELEKWGRGMVLLFPDEANFQKFDATQFGELPNTIVYGIDKDHTIQQELVSSMNLKQKDVLPIFVIADTFNRVVFVSQGYTIGLGAQMMQVIHKL